ncbi:MAG: XdhC family protein [Solirubrobacterales bacterium]
MSENAYKNLLEEVDCGKKTVMITKLEAKEKLILTQEMLFENEPSNVDNLLLETARKTIETGNLEFIKINDSETCLIEPFFPEPKMIVFGGGHIAKPLVEFGTRAGFAVTVIDDRPSFANSQRFPDAERVICESFEKCFDLININEATFAVIVTRGHKHDLDCMRKVLKHKTAYTGMIGSKRRVRAAMQMLLDEGFSKETIDNVNSPIGLEIGAVTPDEIAFSIIAELIKYRRIVYASRNNPNVKTNWPEFDRDVLLELAKDDQPVRSIVTIVSTKGSVPRKAGAKMLVWPRGEITGSIGGGCSEGAVIDNARYILRNGGYQLQHVDMTGDVAEDEGMVCGGIMDVVIEAY